MYNLERRLRYSQLLTKYCLCNLFQLNLNQNKTNCSKNILSYGICVREMSPWPECNYFSQFAAISGLVIVKNVLISFIKECRELTLMPPCDVITMKNTLSGIIWDDFIISQVKLSSVFNILTFLKWPPFWGRDKLFLPEVIPEVVWVFDRRFSWTIDGGISISKFDHHWRHECVKHNLHNRRHRQICTSKYCLCGTSFS